MCCRLWPKKPKPGTSKVLQGPQLTPQSSANPAEVEAAREPSATGRGWALTGLLKRTKSDGARRGRASFDGKDRLMAGMQGQPYA